LNCSSISACFVGGKSIRKPPKRNIQQLVAQPSTTSENSTLHQKIKTMFFLKLLIGTESSRSIDQASPCHQIVSLIENKAKKLCKNQGMDMIT